MNNPKKCKNCDTGYLLPAMGKLQCSYCGQRSVFPAVDLPREPEQKPREPQPQKAAESDLVGELLEAIFRDGGQRRRSLDDDHRAVAAAVSEVRELIRTLEAYQRRRRDFDSICTTKSDHEVCIISELDGLRAQVAQRAADTERLAFLVDGERGANDDRLIEMTLRSIEDDKPTLQEWRDAIDAALRAEAAQRAACDAPGSAGQDPMFGSLTIS